MTYIPHVSNTNDWTKHFTDMANTYSKHQAFYIVGKSHKDKNVSDNVTLVSNTEQAINQAQADMDRIQTVNYTMSNTKRRRKSYKPHSVTKKRRVNNYVS
jgi:hypothetical protein